MNEYVELFEKNLDSVSKDIKKFKRDAQDAPRINEKTLTRLLLCLDVLSAEIEEIREAVKPSEKLKLAVNS